MAKHEIEKMRKDPVRRNLRVESKHYVTPHMLRILFHSDGLEGFDSPSPDDHIKLFFPLPGEEPAKRDFTPRAWNCETGTFTIDFALHSKGPATEWAQAAQKDDILEIGGPRGSVVVPDDFDWYLLIGDACALPSFSRRLETLRPGVPVHLFVLLDDAGEHPPLDSRADVHASWLTSKESSAEDANQLRDALQDLPLPHGDGFIWIAAEANVSRDLYKYLVEERRHPAEWIKASAYWTKSQQ